MFFLAFLFTLGLLGVEGDKAITPAETAASSRVHLSPAEDATTRLREVAQRLKELLGDTGSGSVGTNHIDAADADGMTRDDGASREQGDCPTNYNRVIGPSTTAELDVTSDSLLWGEPGPEAAAFLIFVLDSATGDATLRVTDRTTSEFAESATSGQEVVRVETAGIPGSPGVQWTVTCSSGAPDCEWVSVSSLRVRTSTASG
ncbi:unnamed protein product [Vitrella brassicaformis CCMP3155]|uniref:PLAT domain-containing protein n=1 Tax=Vitrella brassicaformis (strain CCMP3155) TaxID=1169540 RepID=A0A0G4FUE1_VITBC|nr:unnamed protein product [Vitrella brassicaformis CCMP3155]|eukprot:CEM18541.1 unnamed protein product [Vitrella brassicaformis CCMP3155]